MKRDRRDFLKSSGLAGVSLTAGGVLPACTTSPVEPAAAAAADRTQSDPEWRRVKYGSWGGPGVPEGAGPMDDVSLKDYAPRSSAVLPETFVPKARYPVIDAHVHNYAEGAGGDPDEELARWVETMDEVGIELSVVLTGATGDRFDRLVDYYLGSWPDRFQLYCGLDMQGIDEPDYPRRAERELERCFRGGARGVGELTDKGKGLTRDRSLAPAARLHPDDPRLDLFWRKCAELRLPVNLHVADHPSAWEPPDVFQERTPVFQQFNQYGEDILSHGELLAVRDRTLERHPDTVFICCHLGNQGHDPAALGKALERYPNLYLDLSARDYEIGRMPRAASKFLADWPDRVLFGTDMGMDKEMYQSWWRLLESADEYMTGRIWWSYYGIELPSEILERLYRGNARRILNWKEV